MKVEYGFIEYSEPKLGVFLITTNEYRFPDGWVQKEEEILIIGEDDDSFVHRLLHTQHGEWIGDVVVQRELILPIGVHKSRFVRWQPTQLPLFK